MDIVYGPVNQEIYDHGGSKLYREGRTEDGTLHRQLIAESHHDERFALALGNFVSWYADNVGLAGQAPILLEMELPGDGVALNGEGPELVASGAVVVPQ